MLCEQNNKQLIKPYTETKLNKTQTKNTTQDYIKHQDSYINKITLQLQIKTQNQTQEQQLP